jgi:uncharacterized Zn-finger protein
MNKHTRPFICPFDRCPQLFSRQSDLKRHEDSVHKQQARFFCTVSGCERSGLGFSRKDHLEQHARSHGKRPALDSSTHQIGKSSTAAGNTQGHELHPARKRARRAEPDQPQDQRAVTQAAEGQNQLVPLSRSVLSFDAAAEVERLKAENERLRDELKSTKQEIKSQKDQLEKQTETIYSLVTGKK